METLSNILVQQPMMALFLTIALGYLLGEVNIKGFSLGVGAVLFVALFMGWLAPKSAQIRRPRSRANSATKSNQIGTALSAATTR